MKPEELWMRASEVTSKFINLDYDPPSLGQPISESIVILGEILAHCVERITKLEQRINE